MNHTDLLPPALALALAAHGPGQCGPTEIEAGRAVMFAGLPALVGTLVILRLLLWLWRKVRVDLSMCWAPAAIALGAMAVMSVASLLGIPAESDGSGLGTDMAGVMEWAPMAILCLGTTYLAVVLVVWRVWLKLRPRTAFTWAFLPPLVLLWWPAPLMGFGLTKSWLDFWVPLWVFTGYAGLVTGPLFLLLLIEVLVRLWKARKHSPAKPAHF